MRIKNLQRILVFCLKYFSSLVLLIYTFSIGFLVNRKYRSLIDEISQKSFVDRLIYKYEKETIPEIEIEDVLDKFDVKLEKVKTKHGNVLFIELLFICALIRKFNIRKAFEIGTFNGRTTLNIAINLPQNGKIYTIDLPPENFELKYKIANSDFELLKNPIKGEIFLETEYYKDGKIVQLFGDTANYDFSKLHGEFDLIFIDGSHVYDYVKNDTIVALNLLNKKGGIILWHDYNKFNPGCIKYLNELYNNHKLPLKKIKNTSLVCLIDIRN